MVVYQVYYLIVNIWAHLLRARVHWRMEVDFARTLRNLVLHRGPLVVRDDLTSSKAAWHQLHASVRVASPVDLQICPSVAQSRQRIRIGSLQHIQPRTGCRSIWVLFIIKPLPHGFHFLYRDLRPLLHLWHIDLLFFQVFQNRSPVGRSFDWVHVVFKHTITFLEFQLQHALGFIHFMSLLRVQVRRIARSYWSGQGFYVRLWFLDYYLRLC